MFRIIELHKMLKRGKSWSLWAVLFLAIGLLLIFQSVWLAQMAQMKHNELEEAVFEELRKSVDKELETRRLKSDEGIKFVSNATDVKTSNLHELNTKEVSEAGIYQQLMPLIGFPFCLSDLDSIFRTKLVENNMPSDYLLCFSDSTGNIMEQIGNRKLINKKGIFHSAPLLIVDGKRVTVLMNISFFVVAGQMPWLLIGSFLMFLLIIACIVYQTKTFFDSQKMSRLREDFTNSLNHNMKTPLSTINTVLTQFMGSTMNDMPEIKEEFGAIAVNQVQALRNMIDQLLTTAKFESGKLTLNRSNIDLTAMIQKLTERFGVMNGKNVIFRTEIDLPNSTVCLDALLIENAIANLIENAIKYSNDPVHIIIKCTRDCKRLFVNIQDDGFGIPQKYQKKIFRKYERGEAAFRHGATGFGLGLNYVKLVVESHGGIVRLNSKVGKGSEFILEIPLVENSKMQ